jgi:hypothetical protein
MAPAPRQRYSRIPVGYIERLPVAVAKASPSPLVLLLWFLVSPFRRSLPGVVRGGELAFADALRWSPAAVRRCLAVLQSAGAVLVDGEARAVYVAGAVADDPPRNVQTLTSWARDLSELPTQSPIVRRVVADVFDVLASLEKGAELSAAWAQLAATPDSHSDSQGDSHSDIRGTPKPPPMPLPLPVPPPLPQPSTEAPSAETLAPYLAAAERLGAPFGFAEAAARLSPENLSRLAAIPLEEWGELCEALAESFFVSGRAKCPPTLPRLLSNPELRAKIREGEFLETGRARACAICGEEHRFLRECPPRCRGCGRPHYPDVYCRQLEFKLACERGEVEGLNNFRSVAK